MRILFIGNSFTFFNDMPSTFRDMIRTADPEAEVRSIAYGGYYLSQYADAGSADGKATREQIAAFRPDVLILQEQSLYPCTHPDEFLASAEVLAAEGKKVGARTVMYQTWAYRDGSEKLASTGYTCGEMNERLRAAYARAAEKTGGSFAPVGEAFELFGKTCPGEDLLNASDDYHPTAVGSCLAACTLFRTVTGRSTAYLPCPPDISPACAEAIRKTAGAVL